MNTEILENAGDLILKNQSLSNLNVTPENTLDVLKEYMMVDGFDMTLDLHKSKGSYLYDSKHKKQFLDFFTFVASNALGMNHPKLYNDKFINEIGRIAISKPSLSDIYAKEQAEFVETFFNIAVPEYFKHSFFIEGGSLAVENAIKAAIDWKVRKNFANGYTKETGHQVIHFKQSFHGRSGYTLSLTNTDPVKTDYFPKFDWPRIDNPKVTFPLNDENTKKVIQAESNAINQIKNSIKNNKDDIAALIIEPIQGEGGDNFFRKEFFISLKEICEENEIMFILDEVQTGIAMTGKWWAHQHYVKPDMITFGKKTQVCGFLCTNKIDDIEDNVFQIPSRINSTWGGNIVDMYRFKKILEIIEEENLVTNAEEKGKTLLKRISSLSDEFNSISNTRGLGLFCAFDCETAGQRKKILNECYANGLLILGCGEKTIRFRPPLNVSDTEINEGLDIIENSLKKLKIN